MKSGDRDRDSLHLEMHRRCQALAVEWVSGELAGWESGSAKALLVL